MAQVSVDGLDLEYETRGPETGQPLVLVGGLGTQLISWPDSLVDRRFLLILHLQKRPLHSFHLFQAMPDTNGLLFQYLSSPCCFFCKQNCFLKINQATEKSASFYELGFS